MKKDVVKMKKTLKSTKRFGPITTTHRNWKAAENAKRDSKACALSHGYSRYVELTFVGEPDEMQWIFDFGQGKQLKAIIEDCWDHKTLINSDDPLLESFKEDEKLGKLSLSVMDVTKNHGAGMEGSCFWVYDTLNPVVQQLTNGRVNISKVQVWEHENNSAILEIEHN